MHLSLGGRITLLNSVLSAIPIFYLSFLKLPKFGNSFGAFKGIFYGALKEEERGLVG
jgi:hypothetical protein